MSSGGSSSGTLEVIVGCKVVFKYGRSHKVGIVVGHDGSYEGSRPWKVYYSDSDGNSHWTFRNTSNLKVLDYFDSAEAARLALQEVASAKVAFSEWDRLHEQFSSNQEVLEGNND